MRIGIDIRELEKGKSTGIGRILLGFLDYVSVNDTANEYILFGNQKTEPQITQKMERLYCELLIGHNKLCPYKQIQK